MPAFAPGDKPQDDCDVLVELEEGFEEEFERAPEVGVATFQPSNGTAWIMVEEVIVKFVLTYPPDVEDRYVMIWPGVKGDVHVPMALPGSPF